MIRLFYYQLGFTQQEKEKGIAVIAWEFEVHPFAILVTVGILFLLKAICVCF